MDNIPIKEIALNCYYQGFHTEEEIINAYYLIRLAEINSYRGEIRR